MIYRSRPLLDMARGAPCMHCGSYSPTVVAAHSNQQRDGKGIGIKAHDYRVAFLCADCHTLVDASPIPRETKVALWEDAHRKTIGWLFEHGHLEVRRCPK